MWLWCIAPLLITGNYAAQLSQINVKAGCSYKIHYRVIRKRRPKLETGLAQFRLVTCEILLVIRLCIQCAPSY